ncbi:MAG: restriction endonuclease [Marinilabiliales bacterium]|nr:MAG: restriction endonuclease [Marinilabiliales bacterium]
MRKVRLGEFVEILNGYAFKSKEYTNEGVRVIRITNVQKGTIIDNNPQYYPIELKSQLKRYLLSENDILMSLTGNVGRVGVLKKELMPAFLNQRVCSLRPKSDILDNKYLYHYLNTDVFEFNAIQSSAGIAQKNMSTKWLEEHEIPLPPLPEQKHIAEVLDKADALRQKNKELLQDYNDLQQAIFLDMFGDPVTNPKGWETKMLSEVSEVVSGVTKGRKLIGKELITLPYMRVANVQDGHLVLDEIKTIDVLHSDFEKYKLISGDILLTEGGDPDKLGRGAVWNGEIENCIHQNHIYRVRITCKELNEIYLSTLIGSNYGKRYFLKAAKQTTGIATVNSTQLKKFPVILAPIKIQQDFKIATKNIEQQKEKAKESLAYSEELFGALVQKYFGNHN